MKKKPVCLDWTIVWRILRETSDCNNKKGRSMLIDDKHIVPNGKKSIHWLCPFRYIFLLLLWVVAIVIMAITSPMKYYTHARTLLVHRIIQRAMQSLVIICFYMNLYYLRIRYITAYEEPYAFIAHSRPLKQSSK